MLTNKEHLHNSRTASTHVPPTEKAKWAAVSQIRFYPDSEYWRSGVIDCGSAVPPKYARLLDINWIESKLKRSRTRRTREGLAEFQNIWVLDDHESTSVASSDAFASFGFHFWLALNGYVFTGVHHAHVVPLKVRDPRTTVKSLYLWHWTLIYVNASNKLHLVPLWLPPEHQFFSRLPFVASTSRKIKEELCSTSTSNFNLLLIGRATHSFLVPLVVHSRDDVEDEIFLYPDCTFRTCSSHTIRFRLATTCVWTPKGCGLCLFNSWHRRRFRFLPLFWLGSYQRPHSRPSVSRC